MTAERAEGGWVLDGTKLAVVAPEGVSELAVVAKAGNGAGAFVIPVGETGLAPVHSLDASRPLSTVRLDRVLVPDDRALGEPGNDASTRGVVRAIEEATLAIALETVGACDALFHMVLAYVKDRKQFGVPVGSFQAMKHKMSNLFLVVERARALCYFAVAALEEDTPDRSVAVSMAKAASDDCQHSLCGESLQSFGGIGFTWEHDAHIFMKRAEVDGALFGGSAQHSLAVAARAASSGTEGAGRGPAPTQRRNGIGQTGAVRPGEWLIAALDLAPHPEGGWYRRTWSAPAAERRASWRERHLLLAPRGRGLGCAPSRCR